MTNSGSYQLVISISRNISFFAGALGLVRLDKGSYIYTGSGMRNLEQRIERHFRKEKKLKWHIDYLLANKFVHIITVRKFLSEQKEECARNLELLRFPRAAIPIVGFGSSDCKTCKSHLVEIPENFVI